MALSQDNLTILRLLSDVTLRMIEGEILEIERNGDLKIREARPHRHHPPQDGRPLLRLHAHRGHPRAGGRGQKEQALASYGVNLGICFQMVDDLLDFTAEEKMLGKPVANDLREGKVTLPIIFLLRKADAAGDGEGAAVLADRGFGRVSRDELAAPGPRARRAGRGPRPRRALRRPAARATSRSSSAPPTARPSRSSPISSSPATIRPARAPSGRLGARAIGGGSSAARSGRRSSSCSWACSSPRACSRPAPPSSGRAGTPPTAGRARAPASMSARPATGRPGPSKLRRPCPGRPTRPASLSAWARRWSRKSAWPPSSPTRRCALPSTACGPRGGAAWAWAPSPPRPGASKRRARARKG